MHPIKSIIRDFSHLFFPHVCAGCGTDVVSLQSVLCAQCMYRLPVTNFHLHAANPVEKTFWGRLPVLHACSLCYFTKDSLVQQLLHELKYKGNREVGYFAGRLMAETLRQSNRFNSIDALVPLPLYAAKERKRGYNQADLLCEGMAEVLHLPVLKRAVSRVSATDTQTRKNRIDRWQNMEGRFVLTDAAALHNRHVLLVDDVITTGATLEACGQALLQANMQLSIATLAYAVK